MNRWWESPEFMRGNDDHGLPDNLVKEAMDKELASFKERGVYQAVPRTSMEQCSNPVMLSTKWVLKNKGTKAKPEAKARLVAREFVSKALDKDSVFSGTPGLAAMRLLVSRTVTQPQDKPLNYRLMVMDIKTAFLYGDAVRELFIELPANDPAAKDGDKVGRLIKSLYGTRDAPQRWAEECGRALREIGFRESTVTPSVFTHTERDIMLTLHVDDFLVSAEEGQLLWLKSELEKRYELKATLVGPEQHHAKEAEYLQRRIRWTDEGIEVESDPRHAQELIKCLGMSNCRVVETPMTAEDFKDEVQVKKPELEEPLEPHAASRYRRGTALSVYLAQDRPDLSASSCHLSRHMQSPTIKDEEKLRRVARYLRGKPRGVLKYPYQEFTDEITVQTDSDWATDVRSRRSHSGGVVLRGGALADALE